MAETRWIAEHGFVGLVAPGMTGHPGMPPLHDPHWDPLWSMMEDLELTLVVHAGYGAEAGPFFGEVAAVYDEMQAAGGVTDDALRRFSQSSMVTNFFNTFDFLFRISDSEQYGGGFSGFVPSQLNTRIVGQLKMMCNMQNLSPWSSKQFYGIREA